LKLFKHICTELYYLKLYHYQLEIWKLYLLYNCKILSQIYLLNNKINSKIAKYLQVLRYFSKIFHWLNLFICNNLFVHYSLPVFELFTPWYSFECFYFRYYQINCTIFNSFRNVFWQLKNCSYILDLDDSVSFIMLINIKLYNSIQGYVDWLY